MGRVWTFPAFPGSPIRAQNVLELRQFVNEDRLSEGLPQIIWADTIGPGTPIRAQHLVDLRSGIQTLWDKKQKGLLPPWGQGPPMSGGPIFASHVVDLRAWLSFYENNHDVGVMSTSHIEAPGIGVIPVNAVDWSNDLAELGVKYVRIAVDIPHTHPKFPEIRTLLNECFVREVLPVVVLQEGIAIGDPNSAAVGTPPVNPYITHFADQAAAIVALLPFVQHFEIWNEPNTAQFHLVRNNFASLLFHASQAMKNVRDVTIISGGLFYNNDTGADLGPLIGPYDQSGQSIGLYTWMQRYGVWPYPWDHLGIHTYFAPPANAASPLEEISRTKQENDDTSGIWITEFGDWRQCGDVLCVRNGAGCVAQTASLDNWFDVLLSKDFIDAMFWFSHHRNDDNISHISNAYWGLMNYEFDGTVNPLQHWRSWDRLRERVAAIS
jgi:hypothetical protein